MKHTVRRRIEQRCARDEVAVVVPRNGEPSRVFTLEKYLKMKELPKATKPHTFRKQVAKHDPLDAVEGRVVGALRREEIYD